MTSFYIYHAVKVLHIFAAILAIGLSFALAIYLRSKNREVAVAMVFNRFIWAGYTLGVLAGLGMLLLGAHISHPIFDIKMLLVLTVAVIGGYAHHAIVAKMKKGEGNAGELINKLFSTVRILNLIWMGIIVLAVFMQ